MCYGLNCPYEGSNGTCGYGPDYPCKVEPEKMHIVYDIQTTLEGDFEKPFNMDIWDVVHEYINSPEFAERLKEAIINHKIDWELTL